MSLSKRRTLYTFLGRSTRRISKNKYSNIYKNSVSILTSISLMILTHLHVVKTADPCYGVVLLTIN